MREETLGREPARHNLRVPALGRPTPLTPFGLLFDVSHKHQYEYDILDIHLSSEGESQIRSRTPPLVVKGVPDLGSGIPGMKLILIPENRLWLFIDRLYRGCTSTSGLQNSPTVIMLY